MKKFIFGVIIGVLLAISVPVAAEGVIKKVTATVRSDFSIELNGGTVSLQNPPLAYNGSSYLPVREIASLLGVNVDFKDGVIKLGASSEASIDEFSLPDGYTPEEYHHELTVDKGRVISEINMVKNVLVTAETKKDKTTMEELLEYSKGKLEKIEKQIAELLKQYPELNE